ncbi:MAG: hypothetical protein ACP6IY_20110 [Promethearchaeia archaeon]
MTLTIIDFFNGFFGIFAISFSTFVAIKISSKYFEYDKIEFLLLGLCAILLIEPWWPHTVAFIYALITGSDKGLIPEVYFIIGNVLIPLAILLWLWTFSELTYKSRQKEIIIFGIVYLIIFEFIFFSMLYIDPSLIGELVGPIHVKYNYGLIALLLSGVIISLITGMIFIYQSLKSDKPEIRFRGKLIMMGIITLFTGATIEGFLSTILVFLILSRLLLMVSGTLFYIGLVPPEFIRKRFSKEEI